MSLFSLKASKGEQTERVVHRMSLIRKEELLPTMFEQMASCRSGNEKQHLVRKGSSGLKSQWFWS